MSDPTTSRPKENPKDRALRELADIEELRRCGAFGRYYLARLRAKRELLARQVVEDDALAAEEREHLRRLVKHYDTELLPMVATDAALAARTVQAGIG